MQLASAAVRARLKTSAGVWLCKNMCEAAHSAFCCPPEQFFRDLVQAAASWEVVPQKEVRRSVADSSSLNWTIFEPLSGACACRRAGGCSHKPGADASPKAAAVLFFWALPGSSKRLLRSLQLSSAACGVGGCGAALPVFFWPGDQQFGRRSRVWPDLAPPWRSLLEMVL